MSEQYFLNKPLSEYLPSIDLGCDDPTQLGFYCKYLSIFDHWLNEIEAENCAVMSYSIAHSKSEEAEYLVGENRFLQIYLELSKNGIICKCQSALRVLNGGDPLIRQILIDSLREKKLMDIYFIDAHVRAMGGYDRTDLLLAENAEVFLAISEKITQNGLFLLEPT